jgi:hypothetical protein
MPSFFSTADAQRHWRTMATCACPCPPQRIATCSRGFLGRARVPAFFERHRADVAQRGVKLHAVRRIACRTGAERSGFPSPPALGGCSVPAAVALATHRRAQAVAARRGLENAAALLGAPGRVEDQAGLKTATEPRHAQGIADQAGMHASAHHLPAEQVDPGGQRAPGRGRQRRGCRSSTFP